MREHFDDTQREADRLLCEALPRLQEQIAGLIITDALQERLRAEGPSAEPAGWHELKVLVVSRLLTAQYALVLTLLAIRIRLNIIGRHYLNEAQAAADGTRLDGALSKLTKKRFLSLERWLAEGLQPLEQQITACVRAHLASEAAADTSKESFFTTLCTTQVSAAEALTVLAPIRAELELGLMPHETGQGSSALNADLDAVDISKRSPKPSFFISFCRRSIDFWPLPLRIPSLRSSVSISSSSVSRAPPPFLLIKPRSCSISSKLLGVCSRLADLGAFESGALLRSSILLPAVLGRSRFAAGAGSATCGGGGGGGSGACRVACCTRLCFFSCRFCLRCSLRERRPLPSRPLPSRGALTTPSGNSSSSRRACGSRVVHGSFFFLPNFPALGPRIATGQGGRPRAHERHVACCKLPVPGTVLY